MIRQTLFFYILLIALITASPDCRANKYTRVSDSLKLVEFYYSTGGDDWEMNDGWLDGPVNYWVGIGLDSILSGEDTVYIVNSIYQPNNNLYGELPDLDFPDLEYLYIATGNLSGGLPEISSKKMKVIRIYWNDLGGSIPEYDLPELEVAHFRALKLSGPCPIFNSKKLIDIDLMNNNFSSQIPALDYPELKNLYLNENSFSGVVPEMNLPKLETLLLHNNKLTALPKISNYPNLKLISIGNNKLTFKYLEQAAQIETAHYTDQDTVMPLSLQYLENAVKIVVYAEGSANQYQWYKDGGIISGENETFYNASEAGEYYCEITNTIAVDVSLYSDTVMVNPSSVMDSGNNDAGIQIKYNNQLKTISIRNIGASTDICTIEIYNFIGERVYSAEKASSINYEISAGGFNSGLYFIAVKSGNNVKVEKAMIY